MPKNFCVDDCRIIQFLWKRNFCPTKFVSNVKEVLYAIQAEERTVKSLDLDELPVESIVVKIFLLFCYKFVSVGSHIQDSAYFTI